ncbi:DUF1080 domain-containing protein [Pedobacter arcticus]|uniref:DUF1080 domain-containing protein n=1 Tax=Pedobacter arcticus TaxID=752140 RepID=UPI0002F0FB5F|nr:family 16 glycoside hydrolase [Pedobacter arcticus]
MKKLLYTLILAIFILQLPVYAQQVDQRTSTTKIADLLVQLPALNKQKLDGAMEQMEAFESPDFVAMLKLLAPPGKKDNSGVEYATNSYAFYVMQTGKESQRAKYVQGLCAALKEVVNKDNKGYIISLLQKAGKDDAVAALSSYLTDDYLSEKVSRALVRIGSVTASKALLDALSSATGNALLSVIEALGDTRYAGAESALLPLLGKGNADLQKVLLYALSNIGGPSSFDALKNAALKSGYLYDITDATASYLHYASVLVKNGNNKLAEKIASDFIKDAGADSQVHSRIVALKVLTDIHGQDYTAELIKAAGDKNIEYRVAALKFAAPFVNQGNIRAWVKALKKADKEAKPAIITFLGASNNKSVIPAIKKSLRSNYDAERISAIAGLGKLGGDEVAPVLLSLLKKGNSVDRPALKEAFLTMKGAKTPALLTSALSGASPENKVFLIEILAHRGYSDSFSSISALLKDKDETVKVAAFTALPQISRSKDLPVLISLLNNGQATNEKLVNDAIVNAVRYSSSKDQDIEYILKYYNTLDDLKKAKFLEILPGMGGQRALDATIQSSESSNAVLNDAAIAALSNWKDKDALWTLVDLSRTTKNPTQFGLVLNGLVRLTEAADINDERKLLIYRDAMEVARTEAQKKLILKNIGSTDSYNALMFASSFLDDKDLGEVAANTAMEIALANNSYNGEGVKALLNKVIPLLKGGDSSYDKEAIKKHIIELPRGSSYVPLFNGFDLSGWQGLVANPIKRSQMSAKELGLEQAKANEEMRQGWVVKDSVLMFTGKGNNIATIKQYGDFEMLVDWKLDKDGKEGDAGVYLRGTPQVQIWDISRTNVGAQVGSGGLYNNKQNPSKPLKVADNPLGEWNTMKITMVGEKVTVYLNGELVVDQVTLENYWDRNQSIFPVEQIELQAHGSLVYYRDIFIKELPRKEIFKLSEQEKGEGFKILFDGSNLDSWMGNTTSYTVSNEGTLAIYPTKGSGGNLFTKEEFSDFIYRFEFRLTSGANNGIGIRAPLTGDAAYEGMEIQVLDNDADKYKNLAVYQYHGSVYGVIPAKRGYLKPLGEWNSEEIHIKGNNIKVTLNGTVILEGNIAEASKNGTLDKKQHPGLGRKIGHIGFLGHGSEVHFKNIRIKDLGK